MKSKHLEQLLLSVDLAYSLFMPVCRIRRSLFNMFPIEWKCEICKATFISFKLLSLCFKLDFLYLFLLNITLLKTLYYTASSSK